MRYQRGIKKYGDRFVNSYKQCPKWHFVVYSVWKNYADVAFAVMFDVEKMNAILMNLFS